MKIYDTSIFCPLRCKKSRGNSADRFRRYGKLHESQIREMAAAPYQTDERAKEVIECRRYRKQKWRVMLLHRSTSSNGNQSYQPLVLPYRARRTKGNPWVSMVCCRTAKDRLETGMD